MFISPSPAAQRFPRSWGQIQDFSGRFAPSRSSQSRCARRFTRTTAGAMCRPQAPSPCADAPSGIEAASLAQSRCMDSRDPWAQRSRPPRGALRARQLDVEHAMHHARRRVEAAGRRAHWRLKGVQPVTQAGVADPSHASLSRAGRGRGVERGWKICRVERARAAGAGLELRLQLQVCQTSRTCSCDQAVHHGQHRLEGHRVRRGRALHGVAGQHGHGHVQPLGGAHPSYAGCGVSYTVSRQRGLDGSAK